MLYGRDHSTNVLPAYKFKSECLKKRTSLLMEHWGQKSQKLGEILWMPHYLQTAIRVPGGV